MIREFRAWLRSLRGGLGDELGARVDIAGRWADVTGEEE